MKSQSFKALQLSTMAISVCAFLSSTTYAVEPTPKTPSQEKVEKIQQSGGALKIEDKPAEIELNSSTHPDPAMRVIENSTQSAEANLPKKASTDYWGPTLQIGFPHPLNFGFQYLHASKLFSAEVALGELELKNIQDKTDAKISNQELNLRWHPFASAFYLGLGYGKQKIEVTGEDQVSGQQVQAKITHDSDYTLPHFGWMSGTQNGGFFWAFQVGWQMPSNGKTKIKPSIDLTGTPEYDDLIKDTNDTVQKAGKKSIPNIALLKFGWLF